MRTMRSWILGGIRTPYVKAGTAFKRVPVYELGRWAIGYYLARSTQPSAFGAAASFAALLLWLYYTAQIFLFGAEFTACLGGTRAVESRPAEQNAFRKAA